MSPESPRLEDNSKEKATEAVERPPEPQQEIEKNEEPSKVTFHIQVDKQATTSKDAAVDTEAHLLFENINDLYDEKGNLNEKYKYLLQLGKNRGAEGSLF